MRNSLLALSAAILLAVLSGCTCPRLNGTCKSAPETCKTCDPGCAGGCRDRGRGDEAQAQGPGGVVAYPYYTIRGPRDFLARNPQSIGP